MEILSDFILSSIFQSARLERIVTQHQYNNSQLSLIEMMNYFTDSIYLTNYTMSQLIEDAIIIKTLQLVLLNTYLKISSSSSSSSIVIGLCKYHVNVYLKYSIKTFQNNIHHQNSKKRNVSINNDRNHDNIDDDDFCSINFMACYEWDAHVMYLTNMLSAGKPFMNIVKIPAGPPI